MAKNTAQAEQFGEAFFRRFYLNPKTRVVTGKEMIRRADLIAAFANHGELQVRTILDVGCGLGLMRDQLLRHFPRAKYTGLEVSQYLCDKHGWTQGSAATFESPRPFDLVVCYDVFQYLPVRPAAAGLRNLARLCQGVLHFGALTREDWELYCDKRRTDRNVHIRPAAAEARYRQARIDRTNRDHRLIRRWIQHGRTVTAVTGRRHHRRGLPDRPAGHRLRRGLPRAGAWRHRDPHARVLPGRDLHHHPS